MELILSDTEDLSPVTLAIGDNDAKDDSDRVLTFRRSPTNVSDGIGGLKMTPVKVGSDSYEERRLLHQTADLTRALERRGIIRRANSNPELSLSLTKNAMYSDFTALGYITPLKRSSSLDNICRDLSPWDNQKIFESLKADQEEKLSCARKKSHIRLKWTGKILFNS